MTTTWTSYTDAQITEASVDNDVYVSMRSGNFMGKYKLHMFRYRGDDITKKININVQAKATMAPSSSPVRLQIYNITSGDWELLDTESAAAADTEFTLTGLVETNLASYYNAQKVVTARVYQITELPS